jgi:hypothetical protein
MREPDWKGQGGAAWTLPMIRVTPAHLAGIYSALLYAPMAHKFWAYHLLSVCHLRPIVGVSPAKKHYPEAEYELGVYAINPEVHTPDNPPDPDKPGYDILHPYDVVYQFHGVTNDQARSIGEACAKACAYGWMVPDSDFRSSWKVVLDQTLEHIKTGGHIT